MNFLTGSEPGQLSSSITACKGVVLTTVPSSPFRPSVSSWMQTLSLVEMGLASSRTIEESSGTSRSSKSSCCSNRTWGSVVTPEFSRLLVIGVYCGLSTEEVLLLVSDVGLYAGELGL